MPGSDRDLQTSPSPDAAGAEQTREALRRGALREIAPNPRGHMSLVLADTPDYRIVYHERASEPYGEASTLVITFGTLQSDLADAGFGTDFCLAQGHSTIYVSTKRGLQYQGLSLETFVAAVTPCLAGRRVVTYGASLGGYCAVYFGGAIDADIVSASPRLPAMPALRMPHEQTTPILHVDPTTVPRTSRRVICFWDPHESPENILVTQFFQKLYPEATYLEFPFAGHKILQTMADEGVIKPFIAPLLRDMTVTETNMATTESAGWNCYRGIHLFRNGKIDAAISHLKRSIEIKPMADALQALSRIYMRYSMAEAARELQSLIQTSDKVRKVTYNTTVRNLDAAVAAAPAGETEVQPHPGVQ